MRAVASERPATLTAPADGQTLEQVIGDLQSEWGVPPYPQEYRITLKVADEKDRRPTPRLTEVPEAPPAPPGDDGAPRREKAPGMHRQAPSDAAPKRKRGRRRRRKGRGRGGDEPSAESPPSPPD